MAVSDAPTPPKIAGFDGRFRSPVPAWRVTEFDLRRYESADRNAVWVVHERAFRASPTPHDPELNRYLRHVEEFYLDAGGEFLVATVAVPPADPGEYGPEDERVVGVGGFLPSTVEESSVRGTAPVDPDPDTVEFRSLRVDPEYQRVGIARALVTDLEERASDRGFERVVLDTGVDLEAAQALYESMGYERAGRESIAGFELIYYEKWLST